MIEFCTFRRMVIFIICLIATSLIVVTVESFLTPSNGKYRQDRNNHEGENSSNAACWQNEDYFIKQHCAPCSEFEKVSKHLPACDSTGFKEMVSCKVSGDVYRSCDKVLWLEERNFFIFETCMAVFGTLGAAVVSFRQKQLDQRMILRIQQQLSSGV